MPKESPTVSVIIPTYNRAQFLGETIQSVLDQTYTDYEIIIVDDGSTDNTRDVIAQFDTPKLRYIYQENQGVSAARNNGIQQARGEYIAFLDSDDVFLPQRLEKCINYLQQHPSVGLVHTGYIHIDEKNNPIGEVQIPPVSGHSYRLMLVEMYMLIPVIRHDVLKNSGGFDTNLRLGEDPDLWTRIARQYEFGVIPECLSKIRIHANNTPQPLDQLINSLIYIADKHFSQYNFDPALRRRAYANRYFPVGLKALATTPSNIKFAYRMLFKGWSHSPLDKRGLLLAARLLFRTVTPSIVQNQLRTWLRGLLARR